jgi:hypothetical protein
MRLMNLFQPCENFLQVIGLRLKRFTRLTRFTEAQLDPRSDFASAAGQTLYRLMGNRLGTLWLRNHPGSDSTGCLMLQDMIQVRGTHRAIWRLKTARAPQMEKL